MEKGLTFSGGTIAKAIIIALLFLAAYKLTHLILIVLVAVIIATVVDHGVKAMARLKIPRIGGVVIIYVGTFALTLMILSFLLPPLFNDLTDLASGLPATIDAVTELGTTVDPLSSITGGLARSFTLSDLIIQIQKFILQLSDSVFSTASAVFGGFFNLVLILVISFYLSVQERGIENFIRMVVPLRHESYLLDLWHRSQKKIGLWFQGQLLLGLIIGLIIFIGLSLFGVKYALTLGLLGAIFEIIPFFGPILAAIPGVLLAFAAGPGVGVFVLIFYVIVQQLENHVIYPLVSKKIVGVPPLLVILAFLAGAELFGFLGMVISVPLAIVLVELIDDLEKDKSARRKLRQG